MLGEFIDSCLRKAGRLNPITPTESQNKSILLEHLQGCKDLINTIKQSTKESIKNYFFTNKKYSRLPQIYPYCYYPADEYNMRAYEVFVTNYNKMQPGDMIIPHMQEKGCTEPYRGNGAYIIDRDGKLGFPLQIENDNYGLPAWVFELGIQNGQTYKNILHVYKQTRMKLHVPPRSEQVQKDNLKLSQENNQISQMYICTYGDVYEDQVLNQSSILEIFHEPLGFKTIFLENFEKVGGAATTKPKNYTNRPSPPYPASNFPGKKKLGNNKKMYISVANKNGVYRWAVFKK